MSRLTGWMAVALAVAVTGCQQPQGGASATSGTTSSTSTTSTSTSTTSTTQTTATSDGAASKEITMPNGLKYVDLKVGDGAIAESGQSATVHYTGWLTDGTKFDSSLDAGKPFTFRLGAGQVIRGWDEGVKGMRVGGKRKLTIPPDLGYGARGAGGVIPPNATLVFDVELLELH
jgi:peptidylprolyl isomerase